MKRLVLPGAADGVVTLCYSPAEIALACRLNKQTVLAEIKAGRIERSFKPCDTQILVPGSAINDWLRRSEFFPATKNSRPPDFLELCYSPQQIGMLCGLNKEAVLLDIRAGRLKPAYKPFANKVIVPASAVQRWLREACVSE